MIYGSEITQHRIFSVGSDLFFVPTFLEKSLLTVTVMSALGYFLDLLPRGSCQKFFERSLQLYFLPFLAIIYIPGDAPVQGNAFQLRTGSHGCKAGKPQDLKYVAV